MKNKIKAIKIKALKALSESFRAFSFFIQGRMDIDPRSLWFDEEFNRKHGGFYLPDQAFNSLPKLPMHDSVRRDMLLLLCRSVMERNVLGSIAELGVFRGETAKLFHEYFPDRKLYLLDTFEGFPIESVDKERETTGFQTGYGHFANTSEEVVLKKIASTNDRVTMVKGFFPESTLPEMELEKYALVHLDADLYQPTRAGLEFFYPRMSSGGILIVHDYNAWLGARQAVDEYCSESGLVPIPMPDKSGSCILVKP